MKTKWLILMLAMFLVWGCSSGQSADFQNNNPGNPGNPNNSGVGLLNPASLKLSEAYPSLTFNQPLGYYHAGDNSSRVFVVEKSGRILVFDNDPGAKSYRVFLDLTNRVDSSASEKGLLGLAFHPDYKNNGYFYVNYTNRSSTVIARYQVKPDDPYQALPGSELLLLTFLQPYSNHNGGQLTFGPDGYLYIGTGDGGSAGDPQNNAQNLSSWLGKILRIDVDHASPPAAYSIPADNPFLGNQSGYREEIYAYGLRNPWRFSFDQPRDWLWAADVGQSKVEEIDIIQKGGNYGWNKMEGTLFYPSSAQYDKTGLLLPVWEYQHPLGISITGGFVYYGPSAPSLHGWYVYGDYGSGMIWALRLDDNRQASNQLLADTNINISSFGLDQNNELYVVDLKGKIYKITE